MQQPSLVISHLHMPIVRLQQQTVMPFIMQHMLHMPPASMLHRFCTMLHAILSSQTHVTFIPPAHFSTLNVQRGTMSQLVPVGIDVAVPIGDVPGMDMPVRSIIIAPVMVRTPFLESGKRSPVVPSGQRLVDPYGEPGED